MVTNSESLIFPPSDSEIHRRPWTLRVKSELCGLLPEALPNLAQPACHCHPSWPFHSGLTEGWLPLLPCVPSFAHAPLSMQCSVPRVLPVLQTKLCLLLLEAVPDPTQPDTPSPSSPLLSTHFALSGVEHVVI